MVDYYSMNFFWKKLSLEDTPWKWQANHINFKINHWPVCWYAICNAFSMTTFMYYIYIYTPRTPTDLYVWRPTPQNKAFSNQNKGPHLDHLGSRYVRQLWLIINHSCSEFLILAYTLHPQDKRAPPRSNINRHPVAAPSFWWHHDLSFLSMIHPGKLNIHTWISPVWKGKSSEPKLHFRFNVLILRGIDLWFRRWLFVKASVIWVRWVLIHSRTRGWFLSYLLVGHIYKKFKFRHK